MSEGLTELDQATEVPVNTAVEKKFSQQELDHIVHARVMKEREKLERQQAPSHLPGGVGGQQISYEEIEARMDAKLQNVIQKAGQQAVAKKYFDDFNARIEAHPELKQQMIEFGISDFPELVPLSLNVSNTADLMKELLDNPVKANNLCELYKKRPAAAIKEVQKISASIDDNAKAKAPKSKEPLSQLKSSATAVDSGAPSVQDYLKKYRTSYRGK